MDRILRGLVSSLEFEKKFFRKSIPVSEQLISDDARLKEDIILCTGCALHISAANKVIGYGDFSSGIMLIGEAPGEDEDRTGIPFVGQAGRKLEEMLNFIGLSRETVYICNVLKCRPPHNADPTDEQKNACRGFLERQIKMMKPRAILTLGRHAARAVTGIDSTRMQDYLNNDYHTEGGIRIVPTYHPAAILHAKAEQKDKIRRQVADDLLKLKGIMGEK